MWTAFAVPGQDVVCLVQDTGSASCTPDEAVGQDFQVQTCTPDGKVAVIGLVPDTARRAAIRLTGGGTIDVQIKRNYIEVAVNPTSGGDVPTAVELLDQADGRQSYALSVPEYADLACANK